MADNFTDAVGYEVIEVETELEEDELIVSKLVLKSPEGKLYECKSYEGEIIIREKRG